MSSESADSSSAINQFLSTLMTMLLNFSPTSESDETSSSTSEQSQADYFSSLDTDGSGTLSQSEFSTARPDDVTEEMSTNLFTQLDSDGDGVVSATEMSAMETRPRGPHSAGSEEDDSTTTSSLDTNGDGVVSQAEFLARRPDDLAEDMATTLFSSLDSDGDGSVSQEEMKAGRGTEGVGPLPRAMSSSAETAESDDSSVVDGSMDGFLARLEQIAKEYQFVGDEEDTTAQSITV
ncbi:hypothetical protein ASF69_15125 [Rhizobium sp. Leaf311]|nr:hypothetical protein ASF69_15125 [Rhizobium sp. Leaf311]